MKAESVQKKMRCLLFILSLLNFFHGDKISSRDHLNSVNALSRAYFISTVPSGNPLFMRLPSPIFASNSQNILKIGFFRAFFGLLIFIPIKTN